MPVRGCGWFSARSYASLQGEDRPKPQLCIDDGGILSESLDAPADLILGVQGAKPPAGCRDSALAAGVGRAAPQKTTRSETIYAGRAALQAQAWGTQPHNMSLAQHQANDCH